MKDIWRFSTQANAAALRPTEEERAELMSRPKISPAFIEHDRRFLGVGLWPDRDVVLAVLQLDDDAGGQNVLALVVELDALVAEHELLRLQISRLQRRLDFCRIGRAGAVDRVHQGEEAGHLAARGVVQLVAALVLV